MAMTFTLVSHLREQISQLVRKKIDEQEKREREKERLALEVRTDAIIIFLWVSCFSNDYLVGRRKAYSRHCRNNGVIQGLEGKIRSRNCY